LRSGFSTASLALRGIDNKQEVSFLLPEVCIARVLLLNQ